MFFRSLLAVASIALLGPCGKDESKTTPSASASATVAAPATTSAPATTTSAPATSAGSAAVVVPAGGPPPDGSYENVKVDGVTIPVIKVMEKGAIVLIDTDGKKPRTWEEEYKRKRADLPNGAYDLHKTDANKNGDFKDDQVDKVGLWVIDGKGNITKQ